MKPFRRLTALLLVGAMLLSLCSVAFATETSEAVPDIALLEEVTEEDASEEVAPLDLEEELPAEETSTEVAPTAAEEAADIAAETAAEPQDSQPLTTAAEPEGVENSWRFKDGKPIVSAPELPQESKDETLNNADSDSYLSGIDVSHWQGKIDWTKTAKKVSFAIIRCGGGMDIRAQDDEQFKNNVKGCLANGVPFGVYLYSYGRDAKSEAKHTLRMLSEAGLKPRDVDLPVYLDVEDSSFLSKKGKYYLTNSQLLTYVTTYCNTIEKAGYTAGVYANLDHWQTNMPSTKYNQWERWMACWRRTPTFYNGKGNWLYNNKTYPYSMWQYTDNGKVDGIKGSVDTDRWYGPLPSFNMSRLAPTLNAPVNAEKGIELNWDKVDGSKGYYIYRKESGGSYSRIATIIGSTKLTYTDTAAKDYHRYTYYVKAYNSSSTSLKSDELSITRVPAPKLDVAENTEEGLALSWTPVEGAESYSLYRRTGTATAKRVLIGTFTEETAYLDTNVKAETSYYYDVQALLDGDTSPLLSAKAAARMLPQSAPQVTHTTSSTQTGLKVSWEQVVTATSYTISRCEIAVEPPQEPSEQPEEDPEKEPEEIQPLSDEEEAPSWTTIATVMGGDTLDYVDTTAEDGAIYLYAVTPTSPGAVGMLSESSAPVRYLAAPQLTLAVKDTTVTLSWSATAAAEHYNVYRKTNGSAWKLMAQVSSEEECVYTDTVKKETTYAYTVRPVQGDVMGCYNAKGLTLHLLANRPAAPTFTNDAKGITLKWKKAVGAEGYTVLARSSSTAAWKTISTIKSGSTTSYLYKSAAAGKVTQYCVQPYNTYSAAPKSGVLKALRLTYPSFTVKNAGKKKVSLKWKKVAGAKTYTIYRSTKATSGFKAIRTVKTLSYKDKSVKRKTTYYYRIVANNGTTKSTYQTKKLKTK